MDLMQYGFWGEGLTSDLPSPFPDYITAEKSFVNMTRVQLGAWKRAPLAVNTQPDISSVGNREIIDMAVRAGCWLRSDSILVEEPIQIEELSNRPPWLPAILEDAITAITMWTPSKWMRPASICAKTACRMCWTRVRTTGRCGPRRTIWHATTSDIRTAFAACSSAWATACGPPGSG